MKGQKIFISLSPDGTLVFFHARGKLTTSLAHIGVRDAIYDILPILRWNGVLHVYKCCPERFCWLAARWMVVVAM